MWARGWPGLILFRLRRDKGGFGFQLYRSAAALRAWENVLVPTVPWGRENLRERAVRLLELVGLDGREVCGVRREQQRAAIASWVLPGTAA